MSSDQNPQKSLVKLVNSNTFAEAGAAVAEAPRKVSRNLCLPVTRGRAYKNIYIYKLKWLWSTRCRAWVFVVHIHIIKPLWYTVIISCCSAAALQVGTPLHNDYTNRVRYSCPSSKWLSTQMHPRKSKPTPRKMCGTFRGSEWEYTGIVRGFWATLK